MQVKAIAKFGKSGAPLVRTQNCSLHLLAARLLSPAFSAWGCHLLELACKEHQRCGKQAGYFMVHCLQV